MIAPMAMWWQISISLPTVYIKSSPLWFTAWFSVHHSSCRATWTPNRKLLPSECVEVHKQPGTSSNQKLEVSCSGFMTKGVGRSSSEAGFLMLLGRYVYSCTAVDLTSTSVFQKIMISFLKKYYKDNKSNKRKRFVARNIWGH